VVSLPCPPFDRLRASGFATLVVSLSNHSGVFWDKFMRLSLPRKGDPDVSPRRPASMEALLKQIEGSLRRVAFHIPKLAKQGKGSDVLREVPGRSEAEDVEIGVDQVCEEILERWLRKAKLPLDIYSEHGTRRIGSTKEAAKYLVASDPFDGSGLFRRGLAAEWWSVVSIFDAGTLEPICGGAVDILRKEIYLAGSDGVTLQSSQIKGRASLFPSNKTAVDDRTVIAAYMMDPVYLTDWIEKAGGLLNTLVSRFPSARLWPNGGSCIYPWLARGLVHAYVMFNEPKSEIDPGLAFSWSARCPAFSVQGNGTLEPYHFIPGKQAERVPFFVTACTKELAENIVMEIRKGK
jgi:fructose-1,6-bisphosphatase/inositol monophosphatase family enzyme